MSLQSEDARILRQRIRDLVAITALPAIWIGREPAAIADSLADTLLSMLCADFVYVRTLSGDSAPPCEAVRTDPDAFGREAAAERDEAVRSRLEALCREGTYPLDIAPLGRLTAFSTPIGNAGVHGHVVAGALRPGFPDETERLLCRVAANQAAVALQQASLVIARKRAEDDLLAKAERESLVSRMGLEIRSSLDPDDIERTAACLLGQALSADRCFFAHIDLEHDYMRFGSDWRRPGLPALDGEYQPSLFGVDVASRFAGGKNLIIHDAQAEGWPFQAIIMPELRQIRAVIAVPFYRDGKLVALLCVAMERPRRWTPDEIALVEAAAAQTRTAIEAANVVQREHRIASMLQEALRPSLASDIPGLELADHYQPALDESSVGGDFYAVYPLDGRRSALVVGDVSGKGLAAASQVAAIQSILRYALCSAQSLSAAVTEMNRVVASQNLLAGFATLFVGIYDTVDRTLRYISCGHEPGLLRRTTGRIDELGSCGPPLGATESLEYPERSVLLQVGDSLLLYTDGLSEAGPDRRNLLGHAGLAEILRGSPARGARPLVQLVVDEAKALSRGGFRDDVCVVAAVVTAS